MPHRGFAGRASLTGRLGAQSPLGGKPASSLRVEHPPIGAIPARPQIRRLHTRPTRLGISPFSWPPTGMLLQPCPCSLLIQQPAPLAMIASMSPARRRLERASAHRSHPESAPPPRGARRRNTTTLRRGRQSRPSLQSVSRSAIDMVTLAADLSQPDALNGCYPSLPAGGTGQITSLIRDIDSQGCPRPNPRPSGGRPIPFPTPPNVPSIGSRPLFRPPREYRGGLP